MAKKETENTEEIEQVKEKKSGGNKLVYILLGLVVLLFIGLGVGSWYMYDKMNNPQNPQTEAKKEVKAEEEDTSKEDEEMGHIVEFKEIIVNLSPSKGNAKSYLKLQINIELKNEESVELFNKKIALVNDGLLTITSNKTRDDLITIGGKEELKNELKEEFNDVLGKKIIRNIYWKTFVIQ
jgi:flagellar FliL protein